MNKGADMTATATRTEPTQGTCMYCHQADVRVLSNGTLDFHRIKDTGRECAAPIYTRPGTLQDQLSRVLGLDKAPRPDVLLEKVALLARNTENAHRRLDELGVPRGDMAKLSLVGRIDELLRDIPEAEASA